jgi:hypothetical protein
LLVCPQLLRYKHGLRVTSTVREASLVSALSDRAVQKQQMASNTRTAAWCALLVLSCAVAAAAAAAAAPTATELARRSLYFESHGRDDLREFRAVLLKGARYVKIDIHWLNSTAECALQRRVSPPFPAGGCLVLMHSDKPVTREWNSTDDLVAEIAAPRNRDLLARPGFGGNGHSAPLVIQLCLKLHLGCSPAARGYVALMDRFLQRALAAVAAHHLQVSFVLDSVDPTEACLMNRWPVNFTFTGKFWGTAANDSRADGNDEYQMVNMAWDASASWERLAAHRYYKFNASRYAFVAWEPVQQYAVRAFQDWFVAQGRPHAAGMLLAYNGDPSMYHVYSAPAARRFSQQPFGQPRVAGARVAYAADVGVLVSCGAPVGAAASVVCTWSRRQNNGVFDIGDTLNVRASELLAIAAVGAGNNTVAVVAVDAAATVHHWLFPLSAGATARVGDKTALTASPGISAASLRITSVNGSGVSVEASVASAVTLGGVSQITVGFHSAVVNAQTGATLGPWLATNDTVVATPTANGTASTAVKGVSIATAPEGDLTRVVVAWHAARSVYAASAVFDGSAARALVAVLPPVGAAPVKVGVGRDAGLHLLRDAAANATRLLLVFGASFCYNTQLVDDDLFTMGGAKVCDLQDDRYVEALENPVQTYVFGDAAVLDRRLAAGNVHLNGFATACDAELFHGAFDLGYNAAPLLLPKGRDSTAAAAPLRYDDSAVAPGGYVGIVAMTSLAHKKLCTCGAPAAHGGRLILDSFPLFSAFNYSAV